MYNAWYGNCVALFGSGEKTDTLKLNQVYRKRRKNMATRGEGGEMAAKPR